MQLKEIMTKGPEVVRPGANLQEAAKKMRDLNVGLIPVCDGDRVTGMLTDRDITIRATAEGRAPGSTKVEEVMTPDVVYCYEDESEVDAAKAMEKHQIRRLIILDRDKKLSGIVSLGDVATKSGRQRMEAETLESVSTPAAPNR